MALGAQLEPLPNGRPLRASILLTATAGRGKNHIVDAAVHRPLRSSTSTFEIASGQSLYYKAEEDPDFLRHTFAYPNEIEGAEALWEFLRPMLSKGRAKKIVTAADGNSVSKTIVVEGPVTIAIPTIRNKTDQQLQTRLLVAEPPTTSVGSRSTQGGLRAAEAGSGLRRPLSRTVALARSFEAAHRGQAGRLPAGA